MKIAEIKKLQADLVEWKGRALRAEERGRQQGKEIKALREARDENRD